MCSTQVHVTGIFLPGNIAEYSPFTFIMQTLFMPLYARHCIAQNSCDAGCMYRPTASCMCQREFRKYADTFLYDQYMGTGKLKHIGIASKVETVTNSCCLRTKFQPCTPPSGGRLHYKYTWNVSNSLLWMFEQCWPVCWNQEPFLFVIFDSFCPTDHKFASCSDDGTVRVWDFLRCHEERILRGECTCPILVCVVSTWYVYSINQSIKCLWG